MSPEVHGDVHERTQPRAAVARFLLPLTKELMGETDAGKHEEFIGSRTYTKEGDVGELRD